MPDLAGMSRKADGSGRGGDVDKPSESVSLARARFEGDVKDPVAMGELGRRVASHLYADKRCFQQLAALREGLVEKRYYDFMAKEGPGYEAFQGHVQAAILWQAQELEGEAMNDVASSEGGSSAWAGWHKWRLEKRFRKLFGDLAKVEVSGPDGGAIKHEHEHAIVAGKSDAELLRIIQGAGQDEGDDE